jgi:GMP reductase
MDTVIDIKNYKIFQENKIYPIIPRTYPFDSYMKSGINTTYPLWKAIGLKEFESIIDNKSLYGKNYLLIDIANGHMKKLHDLVIKSKDIYGENLVIMVGNVANPETYEHLSIIGSDYVRVGIGNGGGCLTTKQTGVGYPMASLISECYDISCNLKTPAKIVADGGMKSYSDIIKALALGADYVMLGSILNRALESAGETMKANIKHQGAETWTEPGELVDQYDNNVKNAFLNGAKFYKKFRGMSTKTVQKLLGNTEIRTSEGVTRMNQVEYTVDGWVENFSHYLSTEMSYVGAKTLSELYNIELIKITQHSFNRFNK